MVQGTNCSFTVVVIANVHLTHILSRSTSILTHTQLTSRINQQHAIRESFRLAQEKIGGSSLLSTTHDSSCNDGHRDSEAYADDAFEPYSDSDDLSSDGADEDREAAELLRRTTVSAYGNWDSAAGRDSNTADESAFFLRQQYRDLVDQNNDGVLLKGMHGC